MVLAAALGVVAGRLTAPGDAGSPGALIEVSSAPAEPAVPPSASAAAGDPGPTCTPASAGGCVPASAAPAGAAARRADDAMVERLLAQMTSLEAENGRLKTDLAYLERLLPARGADGPVAIRNFEVRPDAAPDHLRYRALLTLGGRADREFVGRMQFVLSTVVDGRTTTTVWPREGADNDESLKLVFKRLQRVEGTFPIAPGSVVKSVQIRVIERGTVRAQQLASL